MSEKSKLFAAELDKLIGKGIQLLVAIQRDVYGKAKYDQETTDSIGKAETEKILRDLPEFRDEYQAWYSEAQALIGQILPNRLLDFNSYYESPRVRKEITFQNYMIRDYLQGLQITRGYDSKVIADGSAAVPEFKQQLSILEAAKATLDSSLKDISSVLLAELFDSEIESARGLLKHGFLRASGAICGVVIEKHLKKICSDHKIIVRKKNPAISDLSQLLRENDVISLPQWRFNQHLADIRNISDHAKEREPTKDEIQDLVNGTDKVLKTIF